MEIDFLSMRPGSRLDRDATWQDMNGVKGQAAADELDSVYKIILIPKMNQGPPLGGFSSR
jgi:hypothetical protein